MKRDSANVKIGSRKIGGNAQFRYQFSKNVSVSKFVRIILKMIFVKYFLNFILKTIIFGC